ncbi:hypothetical protein [Jeotgalibacillus alimentarius]|uniref:hypothetical protein n=1 Tax=Jeotgalibacillus alimentarius TaxID=135826 RepID=UPI0013622CA1|nr:hypothetical protein [Jeotgalibacillus alimentarius]
MGNFKHARTIKASAVYYKERTALIADSFTPAYKGVNERANAISDSKSTTS